MSMHALRTFIMLAILSGIFIGIGFLFGGFIGITIGLVIALAMNFFTYYYSSTIVLKLYKAKPLHDKKINAMVERLAKKAGIKKPGVYVVDMDVPNAFATGRNEETAVVAVTTKIMEVLNDDELEGVLAHEIYHIKHKDMLVSTMAATIGAAISWAAYIFWFSSDDNRNIVSFLLLFILAPLAATLVRLAISRNREFFADYGGAHIANPLHLASALQKIEHSGKVKAKGSKVATSSLFIINPFSAQNVVTLFSTHPPTAERVKRLKEIAKK